MWCGGGGKVCGFGLQKQEDSLIEGKSSSIAKSKRVTEKVRAEANSLAFMGEMHGVVVRVVVLVR